MENKIHLLYYYVVNGTKSEMKKLNAIVNSENEQELLRKELEKKHQCWETNIITNERKKVKDILFVKKEYVAST